MAKTTTPADKAPRFCLCGCGQEMTSKKGKFKPGHDARLCSELAKKVVAKEITKAKALAEAGKASDALKTKLANILDNAAKVAQAKLDKAKAKAAAPKGDEKVAE